MILESPLIQELMVQQTHRDILQVLEARLNAVPPEITLQLRTVMDEQKLSELLRLAAQCRDIESFREGLDRLP